MPMSQASLSCPCMSLFSNSNACMSLQRVEIKEVYKHFQDWGFPPGSKVFSTTTSNRFSERWNTYISQHVKNPGLWICTEVIERWTRTNFLKDSSSLFKYIWNIYEHPLPYLHTWPNPCKSYQHVCSQTCPLWFWEQVKGQLQVQSVCSLLVW